MTYFLVGLVFLFLIRKEVGTELKGHKAKYVGVLTAWLIWPLMAIAMIVDEL